MTDEPLGYGEFDIKKGAGVFTSRIVYFGAVEISLLPGRTLSALGGGMYRGILERGRLIPPVLLVMLALFCPGKLYSAPLDPDSVRCVRCHETYVDPGKPGLVCHSAGCNHPVGLDYAAFAALNAGYASPEELDPVMTLRGGIMGCATCHRPYSSNDHELLVEERGTIPDPMLSVDNTGSGLCLQCHRK